MTLIIQQAKLKRIDELYANIALNRRKGLSLKKVVEKAGLPLDSVYANMRKYQISDKRMDKLERAYHKLLDEAIKEIKEHQVA